MTGTALIPAYCTPLPTHFSVAGASWRASKIVRAAPKRKYGKSISLTLYLPLVNLFERTFLPDPKYAPLIPAKKGTERLVLVTRFAIEGSLHPAHNIARLPSRYGFWFILESALAAMNTKPVPM